MMCCLGGSFSFTNHTSIICGLKKNMVSDKQDSKTNHTIGRFIFNCMTIATLRLVTVVTPWRQIMMTIQVVGTGACGTLLLPVIAQLQWHDTFYHCLTNIKLLFNNTNDTNLLLTFTLFINYASVTTIILKSKSICC